MNTDIISKWTPWSPRKELSPEFFIDGNKLKISSGDNVNVYGKFISGKIFIQDSRAVIFSADFNCKNVENTEKSIFAMISFYDGQNKTLERDYAEIEIAGNKLYRKLDVPENASYVILEIGLRWQNNAVAEWENIAFDFQTEKEIPPRIVRIATTYKEVHDTPEENLKSIIDIINKAGNANPDVILLSELVYETCYNSGDVLVEEKAQEIPGRLTDIIGGYAKKYNTYIIFTMYEKDNNMIYNTAVIIGRDGIICGRYRKINLPLIEAEMGVSPGDTHNIFDLDFGRIGIVICYDQYFPENAEALASKGAEIIFIPTQGEDEIIQRATARSHGLYTVVSGYNNSPCSRIINPLGEIVNFVKDTETAYAVEEIDLNKRFFVYWMSVGPANGETRVLFRKERMS